MDGKYACAKHFGFMRLVRLHCMAGGWPPEKIKTNSVKIDLTMSVHTTPRPKVQCKQRPKMHITNPRQLEAMLETLQSRGGPSIARGPTHGGYSFMQELHDR
jgi:hypothetical protein